MRFSNAEARRHSAAEPKQIVLVLVLVLVIENAKIENEDEDEDEKSSRPAPCSFERFCSNITPAHPACWPI
jgi:hypothetical protein